MQYNFDDVFDRTGTESSKWHRYPPGVLPMFVADMDFRSPEPVIAALRERVEHGFFGYGQEQPQFFEVVAARLKRRYGWDVDPEAIVLLPGVIASFNLALKALTKPGESVLVQTPGYGPILSAPDNFALGRDDAPLRRSAAGRYEIDWDAFEAAIRPTTRVFLFCNPHNPSGRVFTRAELERMASICASHGVVVCSDEIHCDLVHAPHRHTPIASLGAASAANTITLMAPSKTFNLPGLKCSIAVIPDEALRERFLAARAGLVRAVNILGYVATLAAYRDCDDWLAALLDYLDGNRTMVDDFVREHSPAITWAPPEGTYLAWLDCRSMPVEDPAAFFLEAAKVGLSDGANFGDAGRGFVRLNFACPRSMLTEGLGRMRTAIAGLAT